MTEPEPSLGGSLPIVELPSASDESTDTVSQIGGIVLAAGTSSRYGDRNKLLASVNGEPIVRDAVETLLEADLAHVLVVVGHDADRVREAISDLPVETVYNPNYRAGQSTSVRAGLLAMQDAVAPDAVVISLGDMPFVKPETVEQLVAAYEAGAGAALAPAYAGERGNPVLFDSRFFDDLTEVDGDVGGREILIESESAALVAVDDPGVRRDVDEPGDL